jgi:hypothetical protein
MTTVFISYRKEPSSDQKLVSSFNAQLKALGIETIFDENEDYVPLWSEWISNAIEQADYVIVVFSDEYYKACLSKIEVQKGKYARYEMALIRAEYISGNRSKFIPVFLRDGDEKFIFDPLRDATRYNINNSADFDKLYSHLSSNSSIRDDIANQLCDHSELIINILVLNCSDSNENRRNAGIEKLTNTLNTLRNTRVFSRQDLYSLIPQCGESDYLLDKIHEVKIIIILVSIEFLASFRTDTPSASQEIVRKIDRILTNNRTKIVPICYSTRDFDGCHLFDEDFIKIPSSGLLCEANNENRWQQVREVIRRYISN